MNSKHIFYYIIQSLTLTLALHVSSSLRGLTKLVTCSFKHLLGCLKVRPYFCFHGGRDHDQKFASIHPVIVIFINGFEHFLQKKTNDYL